MARNEIFRDADHLSLPVPAGKKAGDPVRVGGLNGVCETDRAKTDVPAYNQDGTRNASYNYGGGNPNGHATVWLKGGHEFDVEFAVAAVGDPVYILPDGTALTDEPDDGGSPAVENPVYGHALTTKAATVGTPSPLTVRIAN
ncbi:DUF2190 family protein [Nocardioides sp. L-11A]|uniref:DUF2190 family protein n=1 Tax=Nocardioides sp. L-11A TaxID=3043848 RepID=UPI002499CE92|nr:DUF2190 family protein [Nocardioides sp. L-11A]